MSVCTVLSPLLIVNYVFGLRIIPIPINRLRPCVMRFKVFYILLLWSIYCFLRVYMIMIHLISYNNKYSVYVVLCDSTVLFSVLFGIYYNKEFINCLKMLTIVDTTLEKLGIITNYQQLRRQIKWIILVWFLIVMLLTNMQTIIAKKELNFNTISAIYIAYLFNYSPNIIILGDLMVTSIIGYVGMKFHQINEHLRNMAKNNKYGLIQAWDNTVLHIPQTQIAKTRSNKWMIWIMIQLHLELRKISRELDSIFAVEMTIKMGLYFIYMAEDFNNVFHVIFINHYIKQEILYTFIMLSWSFVHILKLLIINLVCDKVSCQANSTKNCLNKLLYSTKDVETCENISQLLLHIKQSPLKFCGIGLFQFGYKFLYGFIASVGTVLVILIQAHIVSKNVIQTL